MIADLRPYPAMKDSGVPWLGEVPEHWELRRLKYILRERDVRSSAGEEQLLRVSQFTGVTERRRADGGDEPDTRAESLVGYKLVEPEDLVVNIMLAWNGSMGVSRFSGIASPAYCVYRFNASARPWYFHHLLRSPAYRARIKAVSTGVVESRLRLYSDDLYRLEGLLPPLPEQAAIVRFLDHADRRIRRYIHAKQKLIKLLEEQKQAIIHRAVTRGLDPNVRLKPSGVEWLGDVPEHWEVVPLRWYISIGSGDFIATETVSPARSDQKAVPVIGGNGVMGYGADFNADGTTIVIGRVGALCGNVHLVRGQAWVTDNALRITRCKGFEPEYLALQLRASNLNRLANANAQPLITGGIVKDQRVVRPPRGDQRRVIRDAMDATAEIDAAIGNARAEIALLREYRTRLIADVVTGKLDVREEASKLPEENPLRDFASSRKPDFDDETAAEGEEPLNDEGAGTFEEEEATP